MNDSTAHGSSSRRFSTIVHYYTTFTSLLQLSRFASCAKVQMSTLLNFLWHVQIVSRCEQVNSCNLDLLLWAVTCDLESPPTKKNNSFGASAKYVCRTWCVIYADLRRLQDPCLTQNFYRRLVIGSRHDTTLTGYCNFLKGSQVVSDDSPASVLLDGGLKVLWYEKNLSRCEQIKFLQSEKT